MKYTYCRVCSETIELAEEEEFLLCEHCRERINIESFARDETYRPYFDKYLDWKSEGILV